VQVLAYGRFFPAGTINLALVLSKTICLAPKCLQLHAAYNTLIGTSQKNFSNKLAINCLGILGGF
jgi:hypothetical protein